MSPVDDERLARNWRGITAALDAPEPSRAERVLVALRVPPTFARLAVSTPALRRAWLVASGLAILFGLAAADPARPRESLFTFLVLAPLVPVVGVALSYGPGSDPAYEVTLSTPRSGLRLALVRTCTVTATSCAVLALASVLLPGRGAVAFAWLVPALALAAICLAVTTFVTPRTAAAVVAAAWLVTAGVVDRNATDALALFGGPATGTLLLLGLTAGVVLVVRRDRFATMGRAA